MLAADTVHVASRPGGGTATTAPLVRVYPERLEIRDHTKLVPANNALFQRLLLKLGVSDFKLIEPSLIKAFEGDVSAAKQVQRALTWFKNTKGMVDKGYLQAYALLMGHLPYATFTNVADNSLFGFYVDFDRSFRTGTMIVIAKAVPPPDRSWYDKAWDWTKGFVAKAWNKVEELARRFCAEIQSPNTQLALTSATYLLAQAGAISAGTSAAAASIMAGAMYLCQRAAGPPPPPAPTPAQAAAAELVLVAHKITLPGLTTKGAGGSSGGVAGRYKAGSIARFNVSRSVWSVYSPLAGGDALGVAMDGHCVAGACLGDVEPPVPTGFVKVAEEVVPPADVPKAGEETDKRPWYKNPYVWLAVGGTVVVGGGVYVLRRRSTRSI
jgi:hypothetical protein